ncbi:MAG: glycosyltransferase family A protein [Phycisphaerales bacterium]|nr:glycosyltransferase family A protein [Phycisphaerales bacterium]
MGSTSEIRFGVVIPAFKSAPTIGTTLDAVASQTHPAAAVIVVIDGPDPTLEEIVRRHPSSPEVLVLPENSGGPGCPRNEGVDRLRSRHDIEAFWFLDADDLPFPDFLGTMARSLCDHPDAAMVSSHFDNWIDSSPQPDPPAVPGVLESIEIEFDWYLENTGAILPSYSVIRGDAFERLRSDGGGFSPELPHNQDYELFVRLISTSECCRVAGSGGAYRIHEASISSNQASVWRCRARADRMLATWFEARGSSEVARRFIAKSGSAARRSEKELWRSGRRGEATRGLLLRAARSLDPKSAVVLARLVLEGGGSPSKRGE